jgi:hypothetical protein
MSIPTLEPALRTFDAFSIRVQDAYEPISFLNIFSDHNGRNPIRNMLFPYFPDGS